MTKARRRSPLRLAGLGVVLLVLSGSPTNVAYAAVDGVAVSVGRHPNGHGYVGITGTADSDLIVVQPGYNASGELAFVRLNALAGGAPFGLVASPCTKRTSAEVICPRHKELQVDLTAGNDTLRMTEFSIRRVTATGGEGNDDLTVVAALTTSLRGGKGRDRLINDAMNMSTRGGAGGDYIRLSGVGHGAFASGGRGGDQIDAIALDWHDGGYIAGGRGDDRIAGGVSFETLRGGPGDDHIDGGGDQDSIYGNNGNDRLTSLDDIADEHVDCGQGRDHVIADKIDAARRCEAGS